MLSADVVQLLGDYGIQAVMLGWFMFRTETALRNNTNALGKIGEVIKKCQHKS